MNKSKRAINQSETKEALKSGKRLVTTYKSKGIFSCETTPSKIIEKKKAAVK